MHLPLYYFFPATRSSTLQQYWRTENRANSIPHLTGLVRLVGHVEAAYVSRIHWLGGVARKVLDKDRDLTGCWQTSISVCRRAFRAPKRLSLQQNDDTAGRERRAKGKTSMVATSTRAKTMRKLVWLKRMANRVTRTTKSDEQRFGETATSEIWGTAEGDGILLLSNFMTPLSVHIHVYQPTAADLQHEHLRFQSTLDPPRAFTRLDEDHKTLEREAMYVPVHTVTGTVNNCNSETRVSDSQRVGKYEHVLF